MKKKIINGIMMVALVVATSTSFVSCKDTNEDVKIEQDSKIANLQQRLSAVEAGYATIGYVDNQLTQAKTDLQALIDKKADQSALEGLGTTVEGLEDDINNVEKEISELELWILETFGKLVTDVEISGAYNNLTGSINIPGFEPKMLINCWGVAAESAQGDGNTWPINQDLNNDRAMGWFAGEELGTNQYNGGFGGYIYANVNRYLNTPLLSKVFHKDAIYRFDLVNTAGEVADGVVIDNVDQTGAATKDVLQWGWTRAENNNIFKFGVGYIGENAKNFRPAKLDLSTIKEDIKAVWRDRNRSTGTSKQALGRLLADLYYKVLTADTNLPKYGLRIAWKDNTASISKPTDEETIEINAPFFVNDLGTYEVAPHEGLDHMVTSEAELVFASIKPLAWNAEAAKGLADQVHQGVLSANNLVEKSEALWNKIFKKIKKQLPNLDPNQIKDIVARGNLHNNDGGPKWWLDIDADDVYTVGTDADLTAVIDPLNESLDNVKDMMAQANKLLDKLNGKNITDWVEKFTNKFDQLFANNAYQMLQPTLLAINANGDVNRVSGLSEAPYEASGEITLKPTSYTAEILAPAYAKFVAIKSIDGVAADKSQQPGNFGHILVAGDQELKFTPDPGKLYEIVYEAVDYSGNQFEHNYYILGK